MADTPLNFPALNERLVLGRELTFAEGDANLTNIQAFCVALANLIATSLNPDGTIVGNAITANAIQAGAVNLSAINAAALYSLIPLAIDTGTGNNTYLISTLGPTSGTNLVTGSPSYDGNGNYTINGLTLNNYYIWTKNTNDISINVDPETVVSATGIFQADNASVTLHGTPNQPVTATLMTAAAVTSYQNGQLFLVYTSNANTAAATLNVNGLGAIPILTALNTNILNGTIQANSVFMVVYRNGFFYMIAGGGSGSNVNGTTTIINQNSYTGQQLFTPPNQQLPGADASFQLYHGLGAVPTTLNVTLVCVNNDSGFIAGQQVSVNNFDDGAGNPVFMYAADANYIYITQSVSPPYVLNPSGVMTAITPANWAIVITAQLLRNYSAAVFPAITWMFNQIEGAIEYGQGNCMFVFIYGENGGAVTTNFVNLLNNEITALSPASSNPNHRQVNGALFMRASGIVEAVFTSNLGIYVLPVVNPNQNLIPSGSFYNGSGQFTITSLLTSSVTYQYIKGVDGISLTNTGGTPTTLTVTGSFVAGSAIVLNGTPNTLVTEQVTTTGTVWQPAELFNHSGTWYNRKPVWIVESSGNITDVYGASGQASGDPVNAVQLWHFTASGSTVVGTNLDLTNSNISNVAGFSNWYPSGSTARILLFQYNPLSKRIYVMTNQNNFMHIFQLTTSSNDITAWWNSASPSVREPALQYVKSIALSGDGAVWSDTSRCAITVDFNQTTGSEIATVFTRYGNNQLSGSVTRVPWTE